MYSKTKDCKTLAIIIYIKEILLDKKYKNIMLTEITKSNIKNSKKFLKVIKIYAKKTITIIFIIVNCVYF